MVDQLNKRKDKVKISENISPDNIHKAIKQTLGFFE
jgi:hypothetical protein